MLDRRLLFVTGKGGVGKTSVAAALALVGAGRASARCCARTTRRAISLVRSRPAPSSTTARNRAGLSAMTMDTEQSLKEYLRELRIPLVGRIGPLARVFDFVAHAAPGCARFLTVGKLAFEVRENHFDLVVVDSPATGHVVRSARVARSHPRSSPRRRRAQPGAVDPRDVARPGDRPGPSS
jgi:anion-transporting  ArsA/GET3 family ATPase